MSTFHTDYASDDAKPARSESFSKSALLLLLDLPCHSTSPSDSDYMACVKREVLRR